MFEYVEVKTQAQLDKALAKEGVIPVCIGSGTFIVKSGSPEIHIGGSSSPTMVTWGSSSPTMEAWGSSSPTMVAWGSSSPRMVAWGSSSPTGTVGKFAACIVSKHDRAKVNIPGAVILERPIIETAQDWCDYYGVEIKRGNAILYKGVDDDFATSNSRPVGIFYKPGSKPKAPDWDGGEKECGGGLHFWPHPHFADDSAHIVACPVKLSEIVVHKNPSYPEKVKAPRVCGKIYEVDLSGNPI